MSESLIRAKIASIIGGAVSTTKIHSTGIKITSEEDLITYLGNGTDTDGRNKIDGWVVFPGSTASKVLTATCGYRETTHTYAVYGYRSMTTGAEALMEVDVAALEAALLTPSNFWTLATPATVTDVTVSVGPTQLVGITAWEAFFTVVVVEYPH